MLFHCNNGYLRYTYIACLVLLRLFIKPNFADSNTRVIQLKTLNMFYLVIYWTQNILNNFIFLRSIVLPPVGHSSNHQYHCWNLRDNRAVVRIFIYNRWYVSWRIISCIYRSTPWCIHINSNFYRTFKVFIWISLVIISYLTVLSFCIYSCYCISDLMMTYIRGRN